MQALPTCPAPCPPRCPHPPTDPHAPAPVRAPGPSTSFPEGVPRDSLAPFLHSGHLHRGLHGQILPRTTHLHSPPSSPSFDFLVQRFLVPIRLTLCVLPPECASSRERASCRFAALSAAPGTAPRLPWMLAECLLSECVHGRRKAGDSAVERYRAAVASPLRLLL